MIQELGKYYLHYAWFPKLLSNGKKIWLEHYYEVHLDMPVIDPVYTTKRIDTVDYIIESLKGNIVNSMSTQHWEDVAFNESLLNAAKSFTIKGDDEKL